MKILIIGSGGREHAIGLKLSQSQKHPELIFAPGNPGMAQIGKCFPTAADDISGLAALAKEQKVDLTIVGPEVPLTMGIVDEFKSLDLNIFGPAKAAARLEGSKTFSKDFMARYNIPTAEYQNFTELEKAQAYLEEKGAPIVIKASGLAAGKGAIVCKTKEEAQAALESMLGPDAKFGEAGKEVVIEEFMEGQEASIIAVSDGKHYIMLPSSQDHKQVNDNDEGPNTGGMGAYAPAPIVTEKLQSQVEKEIIKPTIEGMEKEGCPYTGFLYVGLMISDKGPRVVEYNCRLGDPEAQVILPLYSNDLLTTIEAAQENKLSNLRSRYPRKSAVIVVLTAQGYPEAYDKGQLLMGLQSQALPSAAYIIHSGTKEDNGNFVTDGGRVLGLVGIGNSLNAAVNTAYDAVKCVSFQNMHFRTDIGKKGLARTEKKRSVQKENKVLVGILSGSASDKPIADKVTEILDKMGIRWDYQVLSAHRTPRKCAKYVESAEGRGMKVLIGIAGLAAALPGVMAAHTILPVIGVPGTGGPLKGEDALHSIVQMPPGIPVATVGIGNGRNAGFLAVHILALSDSKIRQKLVEYRKSLGDD